LRQNELLVRERGTVAEDDWQLSEYSSYRIE